MSVQQFLNQQLIAEFQPHFVKVENESHMHSSGRGADSHFKIVVVSDKFAGLRQVARHRLIYQLFAEQLNSGIHALALHTYTLEEWQARNQSYPQSPNCSGVGK